MQKENFIMSNYTNAMRAPEMAQALIPYAHKICEECLPGGHVIAGEYCTRDLDGGYRRAGAG